MREQPNRIVTFGRGLAVAAVVVTLGAGCSSWSMTGVRDVSYPPNFNYVPKERLQSVMWRLGGEVKALEVLVLGHMPGEIPREEVHRRLVAMERAAAELGPEGWPSNHPMIGANVGALRAEIRAAREAVERDPPVYFLAGSVSGACLHCHRGKPPTPRAR